MIIVFGSINMDLVARVPRIARPGETVLSRRADSFFGGKGANQAVAAARIGRGGPVRVAMAGAVGKDPFGAACLPIKAYLLSASGKLSLILMTVYRCYAYLRVKC